jgi:protocatechuate 3,4-dioxygenase beta subunit
VTSDDHDHDHDRGGIDRDLPRLLSRRRALVGLGGVAGTALFAACGESGRTAGSPARSPARGAAAAGEIPGETAGPFPGNDSNGANVLREAGVVRRDIRTSVGEASGTADGIPLTIRLRVLDLSGTTSAPWEGAAVYLWHADRRGDYSMYTGAARSENYLRGVQVADADGLLEFTSVFPACYEGRWPHVHLEVYPTLDAATSSASRLRTTQLALPQEVCEQVYATPGYAPSLRSLSRVSLDSDLAFSDGWSLQMARTTGSNATGWTAELTVPV